jgi:hypothetical protein
MYRYKLFMAFLLVLTQGSYGGTLPTAPDPQLGIERSDLIVDGRVSAVEIDPNGPGYGMNVGPREVMTGFTIQIDRILKGASAAPGPSVHVGVAESGKPFWVEKGEYGIFLLLRGERREYFVSRPERAVLPVLPQFPTKRRRPIQSERSRSNWPRFWQHHRRR